MSLPATFKNWSDASSYRTVADSYTKTQVDGLIPDVSGLQSQAGLEGAVLSAGFLKQAGVLSAVSGDGYIKADHSSITEKAVATDVYSKTASDAKYRLISDSYTKTQVDGLIPDVSGKLNTNDLQSEIDALSRYALSSQLSSYQTTAGLEGDVLGHGFLKESGVLSAVSGDGFIKASNSAVTEKAVASQTYLKDNADLIRLFECLRDSLDLKAPNGVDPFDWTNLIP